MFTKLEQRSWIEIGLARGCNTQECFQGLREALSGIEPHHSSCQCKESHRCWYHEPLAPLAMGDSGTILFSIVYSPESMRLRSLRQSERTTVRDPVKHKR